MEEIITTWIYYFIIVKIKKFGHPKKNAAIILKIEHYGYTIE